MSAATLPEVIILNDFGLPNGGSAMVALESVRGLAARGAKVTFLAGAGPIDPTLPALPNLTAVTRGGEEIAKDPRRVRALVEGLWNRGNAEALRAVLAGKDPRRTVVHIHSWSKALSASVFAAAFDAGFPVALTLHDFFASCPNGGFYVYPQNAVCHRRPLSVSCVKCSCDRRNYGHKLWRVARTVVQNKGARLPERTAHFIGVSQFSLEILRPYLPAATPKTVVRNPVHCADLGPAAPAAAKAFLFVGRLVPEKGPRLFLEAARRAGVPAVVAGDGELRAELERDFPASAVHRVALQRAGDGGAAPGARARVPVALVRDAGVGGGRGDGQWRAGDRVGRLRGQRVRRPRGDRPPFRPRLGGIARRRAHHARRR